MCDGLAAAQCARGKPRSQHSYSERCSGLCHDAQYRGRDTAAFPDSLCRRDEKRRSGGLRSRPPREPHVSLLTGRRISRTNAGCGPAGHLAIEKSRGGFRNS